MIKPALVFVPGVLCAATALVCGGVVGQGLWRAALLGLVCAIPAGLVVAHCYTRAASQVVLAGSFATKLVRFSVLVLTSVSMASDDALLVITTMIALTTVLVAGLFIEAFLMYPVWANKE